MQSIAQKTGQNMLLFVDGFDHYATADGSKKWNMFRSTTVSAGVGRRGGAALTLSASSSIIKTGVASATYVVGFAINFSSFPGSPALFFSLRDAGTAQCGLLVNPDGTLSVIRGTATAVTDGTSTFALSLDTY